MMFRTQGEFVSKVFSRVGGPLASLLACLLISSVAVPARGESPAANAHANDGHAGADGHHPGHGDDSHPEDGGHHDEPYSIWSDLPLWSLVAFIGFVLAIKGLGLWNSLMSNMDARERGEREAILSVESELAQARGRLEASRGRVESLDETIQAVLAEADRDAGTTRDDILEVADREAALFGDRARNEIRRVKDQSLEKLFTSLADKVVVVTESRLRSEFNDDDQQRLIGDTLQQFGK